MKSRFHLIALTATSLIALASVANAQTTYDFNVQGHTGYSAIGTITVDTTGVLALSDITDYSIVIHTPNVSDYTLTPTTLGIAIFGSDQLSADGTTLTLTSNNGVFVIKNTNGQHYVQFANTFMGNNLRIGNQTDSDTVNLTATSFVLGTAAPASTPEPGSVAMLAGMGLVGTGFLARRRK